MAIAPAAGGRPAPRSSSRCRLARGDDQPVRRRQPRSMYRLDEIVAPFTHAVRRPWKPLVTELYHRRAEAGRCHPGGRRHGRSREVWKDVRAGRSCFETGCASCRRRRAAGQHLRSTISRRAGRIPAQGRAITAVVSGSKAASCGWCASTRSTPSRQRRRQPSAPRWRQQVAQSLEGDMRRSVRRAASRPRSRSRADDDRHPVSTSPASRQSDQ